MTTHIKYRYVQEDFETDKKLDRYEGKFIKYKKYDKIEWDLINEINKNGLTEFIKEIKFIFHEISIKLNPNHMKINVKNLNSR